jgi:ABC-type uncharacterized transport system substrate-binding protein
MPARLRSLFAAMAAACAFLPHVTHADEVKGFRFQIVTGDDSALTRRIAEDLYKRLVPTFSLFSTELAQKRRMLIVAVGPAALHQVAKRGCDCTVISAFVSSQVFRAVLAGLPARGTAMTAVYAEPAPADQLRLVSLLFNRPARVAAIVGRETAFLKPALHGQVEVQDFAPGDDINRVLSRIAQNEVLLALPDSDVYNTESIRNILLSSYRHKQAVIGFSADMVKAGALATTYSDIEDVDAQVAEMAASYVSSGVLPPPQFPRYFRTVVNEGVARSLDVPVSDAARNFARPAPRAP